MGSHPSRRITPSPRSGLHPMMPPFRARADNSEGQALSQLPWGGWALVEPASQPNSPSSCSDAFPSLPEVDGPQITPQ